MTLFPASQEQGRLPVTIYSGLAPSNPYAAVSWFRALDLANQGMLAHALIQGGLMAFDPGDKWFLAVKALEAKGIRKGVTPAEVAAVLGCAPSTAQRHMRTGEKHIYAVFGLNVSFAGRNGVWRIATKDEAARKYASMASEITRKYEQMQMYRPHMAALAGPQKSVQMELLVALPRPKKTKKVIPSDPDKTAN